MVIQTQGNIKMENERAVIGGNNPPSPLDELVSKVELVREQGQQWLDGEPVETEEIAQGVTTLLGEVRKAVNEVEAAHKVEKEPWLEGGRKVDAKKKHLLGVLDLVADACKSALLPYQQAKEAAKAKAEAEARAKAEAARIAAEEALKAASADNLAEREAAIKVAEEAAKAKAIADKMAKQSVTTKGRTGRAVGLKTTYDAEISDLKAAASYYWKQGILDIFRDAVLAQAKRDVRAGKRDIPGITITEKQEVR